MFFASLWFVSPWFHSRPRDPAGMPIATPHPDLAMEFPREKAKRVLHHLAFRVGAAEYDSLQERLVASGVEVRSGIHPVLKGVRTIDSMKAT